MFMDGYSAQLWKMGGCNGLVFKFMDGSNGLMGEYGWLCLV